jgi:integrase
VPTVFYEIAGTCSAKRFCAELELPSPLPFSEVEFEIHSSTKYYQSFNLSALVQAATQELRENDPEAFKVFLLAGMAGLRRKEIDLLEWAAFRWEENLIRIEHTRYFTPKSLDSAGAVSVDPELVAIFRGYRERDPGAEFVVESPLPPRPRVTYNYYRCEDIFRRLSAWLQEHGIKSAKPIHQLRKAFGSAICERAGIHQASRSLRHSDIRVTSQVHVDSKSRVSVGLGHLLAPPTNINGKEKKRLLTTYYWVNKGID